MSKQEKKLQRIYNLLNAETRQKGISEIIGTSSKILNLDYAIVGVLEN